MKGITELVPDSMVRDHRCVLPPEIARKDFIILFYWLVKIVALIPLNSNRYKTLIIWLIKHVIFFVTFFMLFLVNFGLFLTKQVLFIFSRWDTTIFILIFLTKNKLKYRNSPLNEHHLVDNNICSDYFCSVYMIKKWKLTSAFNYW